MTAIETLYASLRRRPLRWLVTGSAGFIGSNLLETLLGLGQEVVSLDNFATGRQENLDEVRRRVGEEAWRRHRFVRGDIVDPAACREACSGVEVILHQAALGSVPRSIADPLATNAANVTGMINLLFAAKEAGVGRFVYASSSSVYGDEAGLPKTEDRIGNPLSPYAVSKRADELYAQTATRCYGLATVGLRYFNVYGPRQDPEGPYAAVIPKWIQAMLVGEPIVVYGDGETSRDFCYIANVVQANLLAATSAHAEVPGAVVNVGAAGRTTLNRLFETLRELLGAEFPAVRGLAPRYEDFRPGDVRHSHADISRARRVLGYEPTHDLRAGMVEALQWYVRQYGPAAERPAEPA